MRKRSISRLVQVGMMGFALHASGQCPGIKLEFSWQSDGPGIRFDDVTDYAGLSPSGRSWNFGDGFFGGGPDTLHVYDSTGVNSVHFQVFLGGCAYDAVALVAHGSHTDTCGISVTCDYSWSNPGPNLVDFSDQSFFSGQGLAYFWEFGDGGFAFEPSPSHPYLYPGAYTVDHSVAAADTLQQTGCVAGRSRRLYVDGNASTCDTAVFLDFAYNDLGGQYQFDAQTAILDPNVTITQLSWDLGDQSSFLVAMMSPIYVYAFPGTYQVCLHVEAYNSVTQDTCHVVVCHTIENFANTGVVGREGAHDLVAHPVPCDDALILEGGVLERGGQWLLFNALGECLAKGASAPGTTVSVDTRALMPGPYVVRVVSPLGTAALRIVKN